MELNRRGFITLTAVSTAGVGLGEGGRKLGDVLQATTKDEFVPNGVERWLASACNHCTGGCGVQVRLIDTRAVKLEGNPLDPVTGGGLCPVGQAALQQLYSPDRVRQPLRRTGERGAGQWQAIGWDEALGLLSERLAGLRRRGEPERLSVLLGGSHGLVPDLFRRFARAYGSPNVLEAGPFDPGVWALRLTQGVDRAPAYDLENAHYVLSFGVPLVDGWHSPVRQMRALAQIRQGTPGRRGKLVQIEPRLSSTAAKADEWIPVRPGQEAVLALGLAQALVAQGGIDYDFVAAHTVGFEDWTDAAGMRRPGLRSLLAREYGPNDVAKATGVPAATITRLAREIAEHKPAVAIGPVDRGYPDFMTALAVHTLNGLVGAIDRPGGVLLAPAPLEDWPAFQPDAAARAGLDRPLRAVSERSLPGLPATTVDLVEAIEAGQPSAAETLLVWHANPAFAAPDPARVKRALGRVPFIVSFTSFLDETSELADLVLPEPTFLEAWHDVAGSPGLAYPVFAVGQPVVEPLYDTRPAADVVLQLGRALGGSVAAALPWNEFKDVMSARAETLFRGGRGALYSLDYGGRFPPEPLVRRQDDAPPPASAEEFWSGLVERGGWADFTYRYQQWQRVLRTPSGRFDFSPQLLRDHVTAPGGGANGSSFPLQLYPFWTLALGHGEGANQPFLQELLGGPVGMQWDSWLELNPETAERLGVHDGDAVVVESTQGRLRLRAKVWPGLVPETVGMVMGQGHSALGRYARRIGVNPAELLPLERDPLTGAPVFTTRVNVTPA